MAERDPDLASVQQVRDLVRAAVPAQQRWGTLSQAQIDAVLDAMAPAAPAAAPPPAPPAGRPPHPVGTRRDDRENGVLEIAEPVGIVAAIIPSTNPTSTAIYKILISLKARNAVILSPHPA